MPLIFTIISIMLIVSCSTSAGKSSHEVKSSVKKKHYIKTYKAGHATIDAGFIPDKTKIILGQPLFVTFTVTTKSKVPYKFFIGGDNRGSVRHNNFRITATDAYGKPVKDPYSYNHHGGMGNNIVLKHDNNYNERLFLKFWCAFDKPGIYTVTCQRTLREYGKKPREIPVLVKSSFKLTIAPFTKKQMSDVIADFGNKLCDGKPQDLYEASLALSTIADEQVIPHLALSLTRGNDQNKLPAIQGLSQFPVNAAANALIIALKEPDYGVRNAAGNALRNIKKTDYALQLLLPGLKNKSPVARAQAARSLGILKAKGAYDSLLKATHDAEPAVRYAAAIGLGTLGYRDALQPLKRYLKDKDMGMRIAAVKGLRALGVPLNPQWLIPVIRATSNVNNHNLHEAIRLTQMYGGKKAAPALVSCLNFDDPSPKNTRNMYLLLAIHYSPEGPQYYYKFYSNPNTDGTPKQIEQNRKILTELKKWLHDNTPETLQDMLYVDMFGTNYTTQHPLICINDGDYPGGSEMIFIKQSNPDEWVHSVFPKRIVAPKNRNKKVVLHGYFQEIQNIDNYKRKSIPNGYEYFVVSSWEYQK